MKLNNEWCDFIMIINFDLSDFKDKGLYIIFPEGVKYFHSVSGMGWMPRCDGDE